MPDKNKQIVEVNARQERLPDGQLTYRVDVRLECGCWAQMNPIYTYRVGDYQRCWAGH